ncbi:MAG: PBP1A family penicillin-binding protein [Candidatus Shapirobacteria bacterium]|nr:PBP1A family penicillin-binding protein [Candidatus Shapirobacteria bacterium]
MRRWQDIWRQRNHRQHYHSHHRFKNKGRLAARLAIFSFVGILALILLATGLFAFFAKDLPQPDKIIRREGFSTKIYDRNGELLYDIFSNQKRTPIDISEIPQYLKEATVAIEDKNFYKHNGFDPTGMFRAVFNIVIHHRLQGGSTLTQQLVKTVLLTSQRTITRKLKEFILAVQIEKKYSKDQILQMYLNEIPYGGTAFGAEEAAESYFGKKASELNLVESAILAGLPQLPSVYSPFSDTPTAYIDRTKQVLRRMREDKYITSSQEKAAVDQLSQVQFATEGANFKAPHFVMYVKKQLEEKYGQATVESGGLRVYTSLDLKIQEAAQTTVTEEIAKLESVHVTNGAALVMDPNNGEILAMVGSKNYNDPNYDGKVNVTLSLRQPGSAIKPVTYLTALKKGYTASTLLMDAPTTFPGGIGLPDYNPVNYDGKFHGPMQLRYALANSINIPAVKILAKVGLKEMLQTAYEMGFSTLEPTADNLKRFGLSVTLGGGEVKLIDLTESYSAFANGGLKVEPISILKITDKDDKVLFEQKTVVGKKVISPEQAFLISNILSDNSARLITFGERSALVVSGRTVAVKTGTTNDKRDNWTIGWTPQVIAGVWVGNNDNSQMKEVASGVTGATPIWRRIIQAALTNKPVINFNIPEGIVTAEVDQVSGYRAHDGFPSRTEYFIKGTEPVGDDPVHAKFKLCPGQEKLATVAQVARGEYEEKEYFIFKEEDPISTDGINRWQQGINEWLTTQTDSRYHSPLDYCGSANEIEVTINDPANRVEIDNNDVKVAGKIISNNDIKKIEIFINDELKETIENSQKFEKVFNLTDGKYKIKVKATDSQNNQGEREAEIGVNVAWDS